MGVMVIEITYFGKYVEVRIHIKREVLRKFHRILKTSLFCETYRYSNSPVD